MENKNSLITWLGAKSVDLKLQIESLSWIQDVFPHSFDVSVTIEVNGQKFVGWGFGGDQNEALCKGFAEAIERVVLAESDFTTSNGIAAHITQDRAFSAAENELIERDLLLSHFYTSSPYPKVEESELAAPIIELENKFKRRGVGLEVFRLGVKGAVVRFVGKRFEKPFGFTLGAAIKADFESSVVSAVVESGRRVQKILDGVWNFEDLTLEEFSKISDPSFHDHGRIAANLDFASKVEFIFKGAETKSAISKEPEPLIQLTSLVPKSEVLQGCPLFFGKAESKELQDLFLGNPDPQKLNFNRLSQFAGRQVTWENMGNKLPHFLD